MTRAALLPSALAKALTLFDSANALTVRKETVMTSEDLLNEEETQQEIVDMLK